MFDKKEKDIQILEERVCIKDQLKLYYKPKHLYEFNKSSNHSIKANISCFSIIEIVNLFVIPEQS